MEELINEVREDFQIPPYFSDEALGRLITEGQAYLDMLNPNCDIENDIMYRTLVKNYVYYSYHHKLDEYEKNYASTILTWQLETEVSE
jgi:hypothetical protein